MKPCILFLTCADDKEAEAISQSLLDKRLVVCIKKTTSSSSFLFKNKIDKAEEVLLVMDSVEEKFKEVEQEVRKHHSYEIFTLISVPVSQMTEDVGKWIEEELK